MPYGQFISLHYFAIEIEALRAIKLIFNFSIVSGKTFALCLYHIYSSMNYIILPEFFNNFISGNLILFACEHIFKLVNA